MRCDFLPAGEGYRCTEKYFEINAPLRSSGEKFFDYKGGNH